MSTSTQDFSQDNADDAPVTAAELRELLDAATQELRDYRDRVRDRAIKGFRDGNWSLYQLNESLENLELEPFEPTYVHDSLVTMTFSLRVDEADRGRASEALRQLDTAGMRQDLQTAICQVLQRHANDAPTSVDAFTFHAGYPEQTMVS